MTEMKRKWHDAYVKGVPKNIEIQPITLPEALTRTAKRFPENRALIFQGTVVTYRKLDEMVSSFSAALSAFGIGPGRKVSFILPNLIQTVVGVYGTLRAGATVVMHNPRLDSLQMEHQLADAGSDMVVCLDVLVPRIMKLMQRTQVKTIVSCHIRDYLPFLKKRLFSIVKKDLHLDTPDGAGVVEFTDLMSDTRSARQVRSSQVDDTAFILYTSGTTGKSKGVELTHRNVSGNVQQTRAWFPGFKDGQEIVVGCLPFFHSFGLTGVLNFGIIHGFCTALVPIPEARGVLEAIHEYKATFLPGLPSLYQGIMQDPALGKYDLTSLQGCFSGGAPLPLETIRAFERLTGASICEGFGLTECSPICLINPLGGTTKVGSVGLPIPNTDAKIVDVNYPSREIHSPGEAGELCIKGPQIMKGYHNLPDKTAKTIKDGWLFTGDIATVDEEGYFTIVDRKHDMVMSNEGPVFPRQVDEVVFSHNKVLEACTIGVPDSSSNRQVLKTFIVLKNGDKVSEADIMNHCSLQLPQYKVPKSVEIIDELPKTLVGKIDRKELKRKHLARRFLATMQADQIAKPSGAGVVR
jgi:long-chain acyl-CoA synthetase